MKKILNKIINSKVFLSLTLFTFIFTVYFCSSVGLYNSVDTPQYFTTEALIKYQSTDISSFNSDPHFFAYPDVYNYNGKLLTLRGTFFSFLMAPLHIFAYSIKNVFSTINFPKEIQSTNFRYELAVLSLFTIYTSFALTILACLINRIIKEKKLTLLIVLTLGFCTYMWKYSSLYTRQSLIIFILSFCLYSLYSYVDSKKNIWLIVFLCLISFSYGIDMFLFISLCFFTVFLFIYQFRKKILYLKKLIYILILPALFFIIILYINFINYGNVSSNQTNKLMEQKFNVTNLDLLSTPLFPTLVSVLFGSGKLSSGSFNNLNFFNKDFVFYLSASYAAKYNFFGTFFISPFLLFFLFYLPKLLEKKIKPAILITNIFCFFVFLSGVILNTKVLGFWGGNQYDIRYFYPYIILLGLPLSLALKEISKNSNKFIKIFLFIIFFILSFYSLLMGWLGVINMYKPALTGERRIWMDIYDLKAQFLNHSFKEYLDATFMNRENFLIPIVLSIMFYFLYLIIIFSAKKIKQKLYLDYHHK